jgi:hypothetical protein
MSDHFDPLDELASAHLDGETDASDRRAGDVPSFEDRVASLRAVSDLLASDAPRPDPAVRAAHLSAALDAFDQLSSGVEDRTGSGDADPATAARSDGERIDPAGGNDGAGERIGGTAGDGERAGSGHRGGEVVPLDRRRPRSTTRPTTSRRLPSWFGAAAAVVVVAGALGLALRSLGSPIDGEGSDAAAPTADTESADESDSAEEGDAPGDDEDTAPLAEAGEPAGFGADRAEAEEAAGAGGQESSEESTQLDDTGIPLLFDEVPTQEELAEVVIDEIEILPPDGAACAAVTAPPADGDELIGHLPAVVGGTEAEILVYQSGAGIRSYQLVDLDCLPLT